MRVPDVSGMFQAKAGQIGRGLPENLRTFLREYAEASVTNAENAKGQPETDTLTVKSAAAPDASATVLQALLAASAGKTSTGMPLYIPASAAAAYGVKALIGTALPFGSAQSAAGAGTAEQVVAFARQFVGTPYVRGGEDLLKGTDCSGFTQSVFKQFGIELPRTAYRQSMVGEQVSPDDLRPGDLLFFKNADYAPVTHVAMYIGDGSIIHASSSKTGVIIQKLKKNPPDDFVIARRLLA